MGFEPQPDFLTAMGRTSGVEAGRSEAGRSEAAQSDVVGHLSARQPRHWSCAKKPYRSMYIPCANTDEDDKISDTFKSSKFEYMILTNSHGGPTETGNNDRLRRPMFTTQQNVIFPVRCGMPLDIARLPEPMHEFAKHLPLSTGFTGQDLVDALNNCDFTRGISQYDIGESVPNLEVFTAGEYARYSGDTRDCDAIDDDVCLYDSKTMLFTSLKKYMKKLVDKVSPNLEVTVLSPHRHHRSKKNKKNKKNNDKVKPTITKIVANRAPFYSLSQIHKNTRGHPDDTPLTLADFCEDNGLIEKLVTMLKKDGIIDAKAEASNIPVLVLACRCRTDHAEPYVAEASPTSDNYASTRGSTTSSKSIEASPTSDNYASTSGSTTSSKSIEAGNSSMLNDELPGQNVRCDTEFACQDDEHDFVPSIFVGDDERPGVFGQDESGVTGFTGVTDDQYDNTDSYFSGGRNATKKRRKRRNATKKRRNRRNATQKRRS